MAKRGRLTRKTFKIGDRVGRLTIISDVIMKPYGHMNRSFLICQCDCGSEQKHILQTLLVQQKTRSCGCLNKELASKRITERNKILKYDTKTISKTYFNKCRRGAEIRDIDFCVTIDELQYLYHKQNGRCALSGVVIEFAECQTDERSAEQTASLDRIDSEKGYTIDNVQWIHKDLNYMKMDMPQEKFLRWCMLIVSKMGDIEWQKEVA